MARRSVLSRTSACVGAGSRHVRQPDGIHTASTMTAAAARLAHSVRRDPSPLGRRARLQRGAGNVGRETRRHVDRQAPPELGVELRQKPRLGVEQLPARRALAEVTLRGRLERRARGVGG